MARRYDLFIDRYGTVLPADSSKADKLRNASINLKLTISDGFPVAVGIDNLFIGSLGSAYNDLKILQSRGITHIVNCSTKIHNKYEENMIEYYRLPIEDGNIKLFQELNDNIDLDSIIEHADPQVNLTECLKFIHDAIHNKNGNVLVHCYQGVSRSTTVIIGYLIKYYQMTFDASLDLIRVGRPYAKPNIYFERQLREYYIYLYQK